MMFYGIRIWLWKRRFCQELLVRVAKVRTPVVIRFCEGCAEIAWRWNCRQQGTLNKALSVNPESLTRSMVAGSLSSFRVPK